MILCSGCFDGLHAGHVAYLQAVRRLADGGEAIRCAVAPDAYIQDVKQRRPYWPEADRALVIQALGFNVTIADAPEAIRRLKPRLFVKGVDWAGQLPADVVGACREVGAQIVYVDTPGRHTSEARA